MMLPNMVAYMFPLPGGRNTLPYTDLQCPFLLSFSPTTTFPPFRGFWLSGFRAFWLSGLPGFPGFPGFSGPRTYFLAGAIEPAPRTCFLALQLIPSLRTYFLTYAID